mmetsp:Transcript_81274/g.197024  ORF Transcript_81274/g.197024 Transcript_81274/m.197024 type:complete len:364 (+) Transcript_81274:2296-3387(+)
MRVKRHEPGVRTSTRARNRELPHVSDLLQDFFHLCWIDVVIQVRGPHAVVVQAEEPTCSIDVNLLHLRVHARRDRVVHAAPLRRFIDVDLEARLVARGATAIRRRNQRRSIGRQQRHITRIKRAIQERHHPDITRRAVLGTADLNVSDKIVVAPVLDVHESKPQVICRDIPFHVAGAVASKPQREFRGSVLVSAMKAVCDPDSLHFINHLVTPPLHLVVKDCATTVARGGCPRDVQVGDRRCLGRDCGQVSCGHWSGRTSHKHGPCGSPRASAQPSSANIVHRTNSDVQRHTRVKATEVIDEHAIAVQFAQGGRIDRADPEIRACSRVKPGTDVPLDIIRVDCATAIALWRSDHHSKGVCREQ